MRDNPLFKSQLWNMYTRTRDELPRTNNNLEGWHRGFQCHINASHPNFWRFLNVLKSEQNLTRVKVAQCLGDIPIPERKNIKIVTPEF